MRGIHRSPVNSPHKGQWRWALTFSLICASINVWVNSREAGGLKRYCIHYDVTIMYCKFVTDIGTSPGIFHDRCSLSFFHCKVSRILSDLGPIIELLTWIRHIWVHYLATEFEWPEQHMGNGYNLWNIILPRCWYNRIWNIRNIVYHVTELFFWQVGSIVTNCRNVKLYVNA